MVSYVLPLLVVSLKLHLNSKIKSLFKIASSWQSCGNSSTQRASSCVATSGQSSRLGPGKSVTMLEANLENCPIKKMIGSLIRIYWIQEPFHPENFEILDYIYSKLKLSEP